MTICASTSHNCCDCSKIISAQATRCKSCAVKKFHRLVAHHKDVDKQNCGIDNLVTLCRPCHGKITMGARWGKEVLSAL